jgi:hypothetical protein
MMVVMLSAKIDGGRAPNAPFIPDRRRSRNAPFEFPFAPSAVSTFTTNFLFVTVDKCYVENRSHNLEKERQNLSIRLLLVRYISSGEFRVVEAGWHSEGKISGNVGRR